MIVVGVDAHKDTHTAVAIDPVSNRVLDHVTVAARDAGHQVLLRWAHGMDVDVVWALEDCRHVTTRLEAFLLDAGERGVRVPPRLSAAMRGMTESRGKSDPVDATAVARVAIARPNLAPIARDDQAREIRLLVDHRADLVKQRTETQNRLIWHVHTLDPDEKIQPGTLSTTKRLEALRRRLRRLADSMQRRIALDLCTRIAAASRDIDELEREIAQLTRPRSTHLRAIVGCGDLTAAMIIARTESRSFATDANLAMLAGVAPLDASSGRQQRHRFSRRGDRQLNAAVHRICVTQMRVDERARAYIARKMAEGKTKTEAMRSHKRLLIRTIHKALIADMNLAQTTLDHTSQALAA
jgi:hypothetical protein